MKIASDMSSGTIKKSGQVACKSSWSHTGWDGQVNYAKHNVYMSWFRCSGEWEYQESIPDLIQKLRDLCKALFAGIDYFLGIRQLSVLECYMFMHISYWGEHSLFEVRTRVSKKISNLDVNGRSTNVDVPGLLVVYQYVGMYNMSNDDHREVYKSTLPSVAHHAVSHIFPCPVSLLLNYALRP